MLYDGFVKEGGTKLTLVIMVVITISNGDDVDAGSERGRDGDDPYQ